MKKTKHFLRTPWSQAKKRKMLTDLMQATEEIKALKARIETREDRLNAAGILGMLGLIERISEGKPGDFVRQKWIKDAQELVKRFRECALYGGDQ